MIVHEIQLKYKVVREDLFVPQVLNQPQYVADYMKDAFAERPYQESFWVICLNRKNRPLGRHMVTLGTAGSTLVHPREVFRVAIMSSASAVICAHNHPSGDPSPSAADIRVTRQLREAAATVEIDLLDHVVVGHAPADPAGLGYYSFRTAGLL